MAEITESFAGWEILAEVARVEPAYRALDDLDPELGGQQDVAQWAATIAQMAKFCEQSLADAYEATHTGFEGEDYIVGYSRALYTAAAVIGGAIPDLPPERATKALEALRWFRQMIGELAERAADMSREQRREADRKVLSDIPEVDDG